MPTTDELQVQINTLRNRVDGLDNEITAIKNKAVEIIRDLKSDRAKARGEESRLEIESQARIKRLRHRIKEGRI